MIEAKIILASQAAHGGIITSFELTYHRYIHGELMTHRMFSRNAMSSRAVPVRKVLAQVWSNPAMPVAWGANVGGMQAHDQLTGWRLSAAKLLWKTSAKVACIFAYGFMKIGLAKQVANRILETWQWMHTIVTATEWDNFFALRDHPDAQPEFRALAIAMKEAMAKYQPYYLPAGFWHLPYADFSAGYEESLIRSAARCARVSYLTHDGKQTTLEEDKKLFQRLVGSMPMHASPIEHQAQAAGTRDTASRNFRGWIQFREIHEASCQK